MSTRLSRFIRTERLPHEFCPGCSIGTVYRLAVDAVDELHLPFRDVVFLSGIGCIGRGAGYVRFDSANTVHGRPLPIATGAKLANPNLHIVVVTGDGDGAGIGLSHLIHAARRNLDVAVILANNGVYGSTGGQTAPTTPMEAYTPTTPYGNPEAPFDLCELMAAAGASYVARWTVMHTRPAINAIKKALSKKGFGFVELIAACPTHYGARTLKTRTPAECLKALRNSTMIIPPNRPPDWNAQGKIPLGEFVDRTRPELVETHMRLKTRAKTSARQP
ncbi:MAG: thiamine pyrophosphate-dependent enzyme [Candidatus Bathyarchaeia archaeon]